MKHVVSGFTATSTTFWIRSTWKFVAVTPVAVVWTSILVARQTPNPTFGSARFGGSSNRAWRPLPI